MEVIRTAQTRCVSVGGRAVALYVDVCGVQCVAGAHPPLALPVLFVFIKVGYTMIVYTTLGYTMIVYIKVGYTMIAYI